MLGLCLGVSLTLALNITSQTSESWLEVADPAPFAGKLLTENQYRMLIGKADAGEAFERGWKTCTTLLTIAKVEAAKLGANQRNKLIDTGKDFLIGGLAVWVAATRNSCDLP